MFRATAAGFVCAMGIQIWPLSSNAGQSAPFTPSWMSNHPENKSVTIDLAAAWNTNNKQANFNGFHAGSMTLMIPTGWQVILHLHNLDVDFPHSVVLTRPYPTSDMPMRLTADDASVKHAFTPSPEIGDPPGTARTLSFTADPPGDYYLACGVPVHLLDDMYLRFRIADDFWVGQAVLDEALVPKGSATGRP
jgi:hypothetical protein